MQEIERRIATQADHLRTVTCSSNLSCATLFLKECSDLCIYLSFLQQSNLFKAREQKYQSRLKALETLAKGTSDESEVLFQIIHFVMF